MNYSLPLLKLLSLRRIIIILLPALIILNQHSFGQRITISETFTGAAGSNVLLSTDVNSDNYSRSISIYSASQLLNAGATAGSISSLFWHKQGSGEYTFGDARLEVYMKHTGLTAIPASGITDWTAEIANATLVFSNFNYSLPIGNGWIELPFINNTFTWNGTDNLEVIVSWVKTSSPISSITWSYINSANANSYAQGFSAPSTLNTNNNQPGLQLQFNNPLVLNDLSDLVAQPDVKDAIVKWSRSDEQNCSYYEIQASADASTFIPIGKINAKGGAAPISYQFTHENAAMFGGTRKAVFYRVRVADFAGGSNYSKIVKADFHNVASIPGVSVYPNPTTGKTMIEFYAPKPMSYTYTITDIAGKLITSGSGTADGAVAVEDRSMKLEPAGVYQLRIKYDNQYYEYKLVRQ
jgi:hypothetical protein